MAARLDGGCLVDLAARFNGSGYPVGLFGDNVLAALYKLFPLRPSAIHGLAAALHVFAHLLLASVHQGAHLFGGLLGAVTQVFRTLAGAVKKVLTGLATALRRIENPDQSAHAQPSQKPCHTV